MNSRILLFSAFPVAAALALVVTPSADAVTINDNQEFINFENANSGTTPAVNGNFQYGSAPSTTALGAGATTIPLFAQYLPTEHTDNLGGFNPAIQGYDQGNSTLTPFTVVNIDTVNPQPVVAGISFNAGEIGLHPDNGGSREYSVILWTAPSNGTYTDSATYAARHQNLTTTVFLQDPSGTQASTSGANPTLTSSGGILAGQTIAFLVGIGSTGFGSNSTGLYATIDFSPVPEPASLTLFGLGAVGLLLAARRHRRKA